MIDVKELRIGSHILAGGVRARVIDIHKKCLKTENYPYRVFVEGIFPDDGGKKVVGGLSDNLDPIPITAELLQELGFEKEHEYGKISFWEKDNLYMRIRGERMELGVDCERTMCVYNIQYLHELEAFVYLTTKQELIKEDWL